MPMYDRRCKACQVVMEDCWEPITMEEQPACPCGGETERVWIMGSANSVIGDDIPGGLYIKHGICNADGSPRRYDSKSSIKRAAADKGYVNHVVHIGAQGSDKSKHTSRWV